MVFNFSNIKMGCNAVVHEAPLRQCFVARTDTKGHKGNLYETLRFSAYLCGIALVLVIFTGCGSSSKYTLGPVKTFDPDTTKIPQPREKGQYQYWDRIDNTVFHQLEKPLNLNRVGRAAGQALGISKARQADNINVLDEVPNSSWYTARHFFHPMTKSELARGPNTAPGPDTSGTWTIFQAKLEGANSGFFIEDERGDRYLIEFDGYDNPELTTSAEVIGTKIFYAAGYTVPQAVITYFDPEKIKIQEDVKIKDQGKTRDMTMEDVQEIVARRPRDSHGNIRALASKFVDGKPLGPWGFEGTRNDDPNDRVAHEHRRELRGMRVISSWLNDTNRRDANTMAVYKDRGYIEHYVQDFGNILGANGASIHKPIQGQAYLVDPRYMALSAITLGMYVESWETIDPDPPYPAVGYFRADVFNPGSWVPTQPIPAFENMTLRDAFWGAKLVMSFSDEDIRAIVETGKITDQQAQNYVVNVLLKRRDKIGSYWFSRINPLDKFRAKINKQRLILRFSDLGIEGNLYDRSTVTYRYAVFRDGKIIQDWETTGQPELVLKGAGESRQKDKKRVVLQFRIYSLRENTHTKAVDVYVAMEEKGPRIVGIHREE